MFFLTAYAPAIETPPGLEQFLRSTFANAKDFFMGIYNGVVDFVSVCPDWLGFCFLAILIFVIFRVAINVL